MKLNHDHVRSLLIFVEENIENSSRSEHELMAFAEQNDINKNELIYIIEKLTEAGFITSTIQYGGNQVYLFSINAITWNGHEYLDNIRDTTIWKNTKSIASKVTGVSLSVMADIAKAQIMKAIGM